MDLTSTQFSKLPLNPQRIAIVRALHIGDLLCAVPAFRAVRNAFPQAEITLVCMPWAKEFVQRYSHYLDRFLEFPGYPGMDDGRVKPKEIVKFLAGAQKEDFDLAIQLHGDGIMSSPFTVLLGAKLTAGYYRRGFANPGLDFALPNNQDDHEIIRNLKVLKVIGIDSDDVAVDFPITKEDKEALLRLEKAYRFPVGKKLVAFHPGSKAPTRRWNPLSFTQLADEMVGRLGVQLILTGGPQEEGLVNQIQTAMKEKAVNLAGKTTLGSLAALFEKLSLLITNDTGPAHIAYALGTKSVTIFGGADPRRWAPLDEANHKIIRKKVSCNPCPYFDCPSGNFECLKAIQVDEVFELAESLLKEVANEKAKNPNLAYSW
ncbi:MAG: glycosyltransferase family 9 protein [Patescibacteria group bacterium]|nr:glycosyltransferase family 9 protein [Patescibacteria group bacterium]